MEGLAELFMLFLGLIAFFAIIGYIIAVIPLYKIFKKCGKDGVSAIIPIYNLVVLCDILNINPLFLLLLLVPGFGALAVLIIMSIRLAAGFGKSTAFTVCLVIFTLICLYIMAFDESDWDKTRIDMGYLDFLNADGSTGSAKTEKSGGTNNSHTPEDPWVSGK